MIKELYTLIKMLFNSKPSDFDKVEWMQMQYFPFKRCPCMMWCGRLIVRSGEEVQISAEVINHENIHLAQAKVCGSWVKYYWSYFIEWLKNGYRNSPYESEAYENETDFNYLKKQNNDKKA